MVGLVRSSASLEYPHWSSGVKGVLFAATALIFATACSNTDLARLTVEPDTLVINRVGGAMTIPVRATRANGEVISRPLLSFVSNSTVVRVWKDGRIGCTRAGDAVITIAAHGATAHAVVWCRPHLLLMLSGNAFGEVLWVGGPPHDVAVAVTDSGRIVRMPRGADVEVGGGILRDSPRYRRHHSRSRAARVTAMRRRKRCSLRISKSYRERRGSTDGRSC
jgi:hypothetical protein